MYIKNIKLQNYRNYESLDLDLGKKTTVLIGKNGAGKTNMITALKQALTIIFSKKQDITQPSFVAETGRKLESFQTTDATRMYREDGTQNQIGTWPISIQISTDIDEDYPLEWIFRRESLSEGMKESYGNAAIRFWNRYESLEDMPVLAFFSDGFPHENVRIGTKIQDKLNSPYGLSQADGYYNWDDPRDSSIVWQQYFVMQWKNHIYGHNEHHEEEYLREVRNCMIEFSQPIDDAEENTDFILNDITVVARGDKKEVMVLKFKNGMESEFASLPAGYLRAFAMAFDIANRAFLLNQNCNPQGIAFIDEIDLHLHPSLAQEILERMQRAFPRLQFIVSTHSPLVVSNYRQDAKENLIYSIFSGKKHQGLSKQVSYSYGIDYNSLLVDLMGTRVRNTILRKYIEEFRYWNGSKETELAEIAMKQIVELVGPDSSIVTKLKNR